MNFKDKLTRKLLETGKKHKLLIYPTLALVAIITAISHAVYWGKGNGKRFVASAMIMVLLITQSLFLTSSADVVIDESQSGETTEIAASITTTEDTEGDGEVQIISVEGESEQDSSQIQSTEADNTELDVTETDNTEAETTEIVAEESFTEDLGDVETDDTDSENINPDTTVLDDTEDDDIGEEYENEDTDLTTESISDDEVEGESVKTGDDNTKYTDDTQEATTQEQPDDTQVLANSQISLLADDENKTPYNISVYRVDEYGAIQNPIGCSWTDNYVDNSKLDPNNQTVTFTLPTVDTVIGAVASGQPVSYFSCNGIYASDSCSGGNNVAGATVTVAKNDSGEYKFYCKVTREKYPVNLTVGGVLVTDVCESVPERIEGDLSPEAAYVVKSAKHSVYSGCEGGGAYAWGYTYNGISYEGVDYAVGDPIVINQGGTSNITGVNMEINWVAMQIPVKYDYVSENDTHIKVDSEGTTKTYAYDNPGITPIESKSVKTTNPGYYLKEWADATNPGKTFKADGTKIAASDLMVKGNHSISDEINVDGRTLVGVWAYKNNTLVATGTATAGKETVNVVGTYGDSVNCTISAQYDNGDAGEFNLVISDSDVAKLATYGLLVTGVQTDGLNSAYKISGKLSNITDAAGVDIGLTLIDTNVPQSENTFACNINLVANKKEISLDPSSIKHSNHDGTPSKPYDGNTNIKVNTVAQVTGKLDTDNVFVTFNPDATLDDANAGEGKALTLTNVVLGGSHANMYILKDTKQSSTVKVPGVATVTQIAVSVVTSLAEGSTNNVLFGQQTPKYTVDLANAALLAPSDKQRYDACSTIAEKESFMRQVIGFTGSWNTTRTYYSPAGQYTITPAFDDSKVNYSVSASGVTSSFNVGRDSGDNYYELSPKPINNYYPKLTITATGIYDEVRLITNGSDIAEGSNPSTVNGMFSSSVTITEDMTNGTLMFQMLDTQTGAITYPVNLTGINIDGTGPELVSYTVSPNISYFNEFGFGAYYHAQTVDGKYIESVDITFEYKAEDSACDQLVYYFTDQDGNTINSNFNGTLKLNKNAMTGTHTATVTIGTGAAGQLVVYATDTTGNPSVLSKVKLQEAIDFIKEEQTASNYYEWMIENTIESADIVVTDMNGNGTADGMWYNGLNFNVLAADSESGVNKIIWSITDPTGTVTSITENAHESVAMVLAGTKDGTATEYGKLTAYDFNTSISGADALSGKYTVGAVLYDNAGNNVTLASKGPFLFDGKAPTIHCENYEAGEDEYLSGVVFDFTVTEGESESGVASVQLYYDTEGQGNLIATWGNLEKYSKEITSNGTYVIVATDVAGNVSRKEVKFSGISDVIPVIPVITVEGVVGNDNWYIEELPTVKIISQEKTSDGVPVTTTYKLTVDGNQVQASVDSEEQIINITSEGEILVEAWSKSKANCTSDTASKIVKVDVNAPTITITDSEVNSDGDTVIKFTVTDEISGVNPEAVYVNGKQVEVEEKDGVVTGSFTAAENMVYTINAEDKAGNVSEDTNFTPLTLEVSPVINITPTGAYIEAKVYQGTNPISDCYIAYKKATDTDYDTALSNKHNESYGVSMDYTFRNLESDTVYNYRVYAIAANSNEVQVVEGSFRTADRKSTASVYGSVRYADDLPELYKTYPIYVALYEGNTVIAGVSLETQADVDYLFKSVADGNYRIVATNGFLSEISSVTVTNGGISYPGNYGSNGGIHFVLDGLSTDVVIEDNSINITADGLDKIYNTALYNGNVTDEDLAVVAAGGTVNITLHASYIKVNDVTSTTQGILAAQLGETGEIVRYIQLNVVKEVRDAEGRLVNGTPSYIPRLAEPITVSFPLEELSGQRIYVASVHGSDDDYTFMNWGVDDVSLSKNYVTITTDRFSVYALYRLIDPPKSYIVKWIDGDGSVMKTETVMEGESATPPKEMPTKKETKNYTYVFSGWDTDYTCITKDTIISAWFVARKKNADTPTTQTPTTQEPTTENKTPSAQKPTTEKPGGGKDDISKEPTNYPYMGSGISPQTGDEAPIVALMVLMLSAGVGMAVINKKRKQNIK